MDRTIIAPYKAEEKELSDRLYKKLQGLMLLYPPTDEFRKHFTNEMFLKPNQPAFLQVMHYLFRLHDPVEFKKRFYWPITDKRSESAFRSSSVEYLKWISDKNQLNWQIKSYLVVMPGGMKFITFMLDLVGFIIQEQIRQREKHLGIEISKEDISDMNLKVMQNQNAFFKEYASEYIAAIDQQILEIRSKTQDLKELLNSFEVTWTGNIDREFLEKFNEANEKLFEEKFIKHSQKITSLEKALNDLKESVEKYVNKGTAHRKDKSNLKQALQKIESTMSPSEWDEAFNTQLDCSNGTNTNSLLKAFIMIAPKINNWIDNVINNNVIVGNNISSALFDLKAEFQKLETQLIDFLKEHNPAKLKNKGPSVSSLSSSPLLMKYVFTPPIKPNAADNISARLPLQDETNMLDRCNNILVSSFLNTCTARKLSKDAAQERSIDLSSTINRSNRVDPVQMLRTIYKSSAEKSAKSKNMHSQQRQNLSLLSLKWKERQEMMFSPDKELAENTPMRMDKICEPIKLIYDKSNQKHNISTNLKLTPTTPFNITNSGEITRIAVTLSCEKSPSTLLINKPVVRKVQDALLNIEDLSTSPSGRLEPLVPLGEQNPTAIIESNKNLNKDLDLGLTDIENDANSTPINHCFDLNVLNDDSIFNTSDTILKDVL